MTDHNPAPADDAEADDSKITLKDIGVLLVIPGIVAAIFLAIWGAQNGPRPDGIGCTVESAEYDTGRRGGQHVDVVTSCGNFNSELPPEAYVPGKTYDFKVRGWLNPIITQADVVG